MTQPFKMKVCIARGWEAPISVQIGGKGEKAYCTTEGVEKMARNWWDEGGGAAPKLISVNTTEGDVGENKGLVERGQGSNEEACQCRH